MRNSVTVVPADSLIMVDGEALRLTFDTPEGLHALQWHDGQGEMEWADDYNHPLSGEALYAEEVAPFVALWEAEKTRLEEEAAEAEAACLAAYNTPSARAERVRRERDQRVTACRWLMERHRDELDAGQTTTLSDAQYRAWLAYAQALRDLPQAEGFPWDGGEGVPWPVRPE